MRALHFAKPCDCIAYATGQLLYGLDATPRRRAQLFAQQKLRLSYDARERIVNLMADVGDELGYLYELCFVLGNQRAQALFLRIRRFRL